MLNDLKLKLQYLVLLIFCFMTGGCRLENLQEQLKIMLDDMKVTVKNDSQVIKKEVKPRAVQPGPNQELMKQLIHEAKKGGIEAQWKLGILLMSFYLPEYDRAAFFWFSEAAKSSQTGAYLLAECYYNGIGTSIDYKAAFDIFSILEKNNHSLSKLKLAQMYYFGQGTIVDKAKSKSFFFALAKKGMPLAKTWVAILFKDIDSPEEGYDEVSYSKDWIEIAAEKGDKEAIRLNEILKSPGLE